MTAKRSVTAVLVAVLGACAAHDGDSAASGGMAEPSLPQAGPTGSAEGAALTRAALETAANALLEALRTGGGNALLAPSAHVTEDGKDVTLDDSRLAGARSYPYRTFVADETTGQATVLGVADVGALPIEFALRFKALASGALSEVELITVRAGEFLFAAPTALVAANEMYTTTVAEAQRQTRAELVAVANAYFDGIEAASGDSVPFADACVRFENGVQTTGNPAQHPMMALDCTKSLGTLGFIERVRDRRFTVVDVERGLVVAMSLFDVPGGPYTVHLPSQPIEMTYPANTWHVAEVFKVVGGKIERVEAVLRFAPLGTTSAWSAEASTSDAPTTPVI